MGYQRIIVLAMAVIEFPRRTTFSYYLRCFKSTESGYSNYDKKPYYARIGPVQFLKIEKCGLLDLCSRH